MVTDRPTGGAWAAAAFVVVSALTLSGCVDNPVDHTDQTDDTPAVPAPDLRRFSATFTVLGPGGGQLDIAADVYQQGPDPGATALLLLHGASGVKENYWGPLSIPGYSTGIAMSHNRTVFALDRPGYGASDGPDELQSVANEAYIHDQIAAQVRDGSYATEGGQAHAFDRVAALGLSMGAFMVGAVQGLHESYDAIISIGWAADAVSQEFYAAANCDNSGGTDCYPANAADDFVLERANATVIDEVTSGYEGTPVGLLPSYIAWNNMAAGIATGHAATTRDQPSLYQQTTGRITVPVLNLFGEHDWYIDVSRAVETAPASYSGTSDLTTETIAGIGHMSLHHDNHAAVQILIEAWLQDRQL